MYNQASWIVFLLVHEMSDGDDIKRLRQLIDGARAQRTGAQMGGSGAFMSLVAWLQQMGVRPPPGGPERNRPAIPDARAPFPLDRRRGLTRPPHDHAVRSQA